MSTIKIRHVPDSDHSMFKVEHMDQKSSIPISLTMPFGFPVKGRPKSDLMQELRWYLEDFLEYPFPPNTDRAQNTLDALDNWGEQVFDDLFFDSTLKMFKKAKKDYNEKLRLQIISDEGHILQWPWEALVSSKGNYLGVSTLLERCLSNKHEPDKLQEDLPNNSINILLIIARPKKNDARYRSISRSLVETIENNNIPVHIHVLRPPTFENPRKHL